MQRTFINELLLVCLVFTLGGSPSAFANEAPLLSNFAWLEASENAPVCNLGYHPDALPAFVRGVQANTDETIEALNHKRTAEIISLQKRNELSFEKNPPILVEADGFRVNVSNALLLLYGDKLIMAHKAVIVDKYVDPLIAKYAQVWRAFQEVELKNRRAAFNQSKGGRLTDENLDYQGRLPNPKLPDGPVFEQLSKYLEHKEYYAEINHEPKILVLMIKALSKEDIKVKALIHELGKKEALRTLQDKLKNLIETESSEAQKYSVEDSQKLELILQQERIPLSVKGELEALQKLGETVSGKYRERAAEIAKRNFPGGKKGLIKSWSRYLATDYALPAHDWFVGAPAIIKAINNKLEQAFALPAMVREQPKQYNGVLVPAAKLNEFKSEIFSYLEDFKNNLLKKVLSADGLTLTLTLQNVHAQFKPELGTAILTTSENPTAKNPKGPLILDLHGSGVVTSAGLSNAGMNPLKEFFGFSSISPDINSSGLAPSFDHQEQVLSFINRLAKKEVKEKYGLKTDQEVPYERPIILLGRSTGAYQGVMHDLMFGGKDNPVDFYSLISYSDPATSEEQTESLYDRASKELFPGLLQDAMTKADQFAGEGLVLLEKLLKKHPDLMKNAGNNIVFHQGDHDSDSGVHAIEQLHALRDRYLPYAHIVEYRMPERQVALFNALMVPEEVYVDASGNRVPADHEGATKVTLDMLEALHGLLSATPDNVVGMPRAQTFQAFANLCLHMDYMADGIGKEHSWPSERDRMSQEKVKKMRIEYGVPTIFEWLLKQKNISLEEVKAFKNPIQNSTNYVERMAFAYQDWIREKARVVALGK